MTSVDDAQPSDRSALPGGDRSGRWPLHRWFVSTAALGLPQAAGPVAFSLLALSANRDASGGAAMILGMTLAQVAGAIPVTRLGRNVAPATFLRLLVGIRTAALATIALLAACGTPFPWLIASAAVAGSVNGAAYGYMRAVLNRLVPVARLPRAIGIAATLNEMTFVLGPVAASGLGSVSPVLAVLAIAALGAAPALLVPQVGTIHLGDARHVPGALLTPSILLWLACAVQFCGLIAERWFFFAQANHPQNLYYQAVS